MIIQAYTHTPERSGSPTIWDNATQVEYFRVSPDEYVQEGDTMYFHGLVHSQRRSGLYDKDRSVRVVRWIDRLTNNSHQLGSIDDVFILNDEGKTIVRV